MAGAGLGPPPGSSISEEDRADLWQGLDSLSAPMTAENGKAGLQPLVGSITEYAIFMLDSKGRVMSWNAGAERIKGYSPDEIIGQHFSCFYTTKDRTDGVPDRALVTALRDGKHEATGWRVRKDGSRFMAHVLIEPLRDAAGDLIGFAKITRDVTEHARIAHDFNNVLHVVDTGIEALRRLLPQGDSRAASVLDMLGRNLDSASKMTRQLLSYPVEQALGANEASPAKKLAGLRVLVVEDESLIAMHVEDLLEQLGCTVIGLVTSVQKALDAVAATEMDLALLDINLQGESSYAVAEALQARNVPFVFMSGDRSVDEQWSHYPKIRKPFQLDEMRREMERAVLRA
jgi:PAS domain S-box-containing protein